MKFKSIRVKFKNAVRNFLFENSFHVILGQKKSLRAQKTGCGKARAKNAVLKILVIF